MQVRVSAMSADIKSRELGSGGPNEAVRLFLNHPWEQELLQMHSMETQQANTIISPDMTFTALPAHLVVAAEGSGYFNVEVCLPRPKKLLGFISRVRFYTFKNIPRERVSNMIREFCGDLLEHKHSYFSGQQHA
jgi:hypothetical protein